VKEKTIDEASDRVLKNTQTYLTYNPATFGPFGCCTFQKKIDMLIYFVTIRLVTMGNINIRLFSIGKIALAVFVIGLAGASTVIPQLSFAQNPLPPQTGKYEDLAASWWQWAYSTSISDPNNQFGDPNNPFPGPRAVDCSLNQPQRNVWFLAGTTFEPFTGSERSCTIPTGTFLFFPLLNGACDNLTPPTVGVTDPTILGDCVSNIFTGVDITSLTATVDGVPVVEDLTQFRIRSPPFTFTAVADNPFIEQANPVPAGEGLAVSEGFYILLTPMSPGEHVISFGGVVSFVDEMGVPQTFETSVTYIITVVPPGRA
jgi:hypothetical protein